MSKEYFCDVCKKLTIPTMYNWVGWPTICSSKCLEWFFHYYSKPQGKLVYIAKCYVIDSTWRCDDIKLPVASGVIKKHFDKIIEREWKMMKDKDNNKYFKSVHEWIAFIDEDRPNRLYYECKSCNTRYKMKDINVLRKICLNCFIEKHGDEVIHNYLDKIVKEKWKEWNK